jgi:hypothetical protein
MNEQQQEIQMIKAEVYDANKRAAFYEGFIASIGQALGVESKDMKDISTKLQEAIEFYNSNKEKPAE